MDKIMVMTGTQGVGKTTLAEKLAQGKNVYSCEESDLSRLQGLDELTEVIIVEGCRDLRRIEQFARNSFLSFRKPYTKAALTIKMPQLILTSCCLAKKDFGRGLKATFIEISKA